MKANYKLRNRLSYLIFGGLSVLTAVSCGSSQSTTADRDGIYGDSRYDRRSETTSSSAYYRDYFGTLHDETLVYTDAENYSSSDSAKAEQPREATGYAGWGSESDNVTVNIYGNNWGWNNWYAPSWGWGWNNWYGPSWGWGWNSWYGPSWGIGWGWNSWGAGWYGGWGWNNWYGPGWGWGYNQWYSPHWYGHNHHHYAYGGGRRGSYYNSGLRNTMGRSTYAPGTRTTRTTFSNNTSRTRFSTTRTRDYNNNTTIRNSGNTRNSNTGGIRQAPVRNNSGNVRQSTPTRSYSPASSGGTRSGGFSTGGGGGTRGGGGGGGRR